MALDLKIIRNVARREAIKITVTQWLIVLLAVALISFASATTITNSQISSTSLSSNVVGSTTEYEITSYSKTIVALPQVDYYDFRVGRIDDENKVAYLIAQQGSGKALIQVDLDAKTAAEVADYPAFNWDYSAADPLKNVALSTMGYYVVSSNASDSNKIHIWKGGSLLQTISDVFVADGVHKLFINKGKYIIATRAEGGGISTQVAILEGS